MKYKLIFLAFLLLNSSKVFASGSNSSEGSFPQLKISTFPEQIFWFLIIFFLLYLFIIKYVVPKIIAIQTSRERLINQNTSTNKKNIKEAEKIKKIIYLQLKEVQEVSKSNIKKITQELLQVEEKRINEIKLNNDNIKRSKQDIMNKLDKEFFNNYKTSLYNITNIILTKLDTSIPEDIINKEINNISLKKVNKNA